MNRIAECLTGKNIFITGATGFLGQPLVEKILWSAPEVKRIYVLVRPKRQFGGRLLIAQERLERELYQSSVFERLQGKYQADLEDFLREKLVAVSGDISQEGLGIEKRELERLRGELDIVINSAAVVSFDAGLDEALELNVFGAKRFAEFAANCERAVTIHVSTAYVCGATDGSVPESNYHLEREAQQEDLFLPRKFKNVQLEIEKISALVEAIRKKSESRELRRSLNAAFLKRFRKERGRKRLRRHREVQRLKERWLRERLSREGMNWARERGWNDTYTYTKALGEQMVLQHRGSSPTTIIRPSIIESSLSEPVPGWLDGLRMADPLIVAIGKGRLRSLPLNPNVNLDLVPVDMVVNAILAAISKLDRDKGRGEVEVIQVATSSKNPVTLRELHDLIYEYFSKNPMLDKEGNAVRIKPLRFPKPAAFRLQHRLKSVPLDTAERTLKRLPLFDAAQKAKRRVSATKAAHERLYYYGELYEPYLNLTCTFDVTKALHLFEKLEDTDKEEFNFDVARLNWRHYIQNVHIPGVKKHILKIEGMGTLEMSEKLPAGMPAPETITGLLKLSVAQYGDKPALQIKRNGDWERLSYLEIEAKATEAAQRLLRFGLRKGDRVVLYSENQPEWGIAYLAASFAGLAVVPVDSQTWHKEVWSVCNFTGAKAVLLSERCMKKLPPEGLRENEERSQPALLLNVNGQCRPFQLSENPKSCPPGEGNKVEQFELPEICADDIASIIFTTGTAVDPRGAVHTHRSFLNNLRGVNHYLSVSESDHLLSVLPLYHALEFSCGFLMALHRGATVTYANSLKPRALLQTMRETGTTCLLGVPTLFALIRDDIERRILGASRSTIKTNLVKRSKQLSRSLERRFGRNVGRRLFAQVHQEFGGAIRVFVSGGSRLGRSLYRDFQAMGIPIYEGYGLTETAPVLTVNPLHRSREGSAGKPLPGVELRLFRPDEDGVGEIIVRTPSLMKEYFRNPAATASVMQNGWFHTGDLGWVDADGYIYITGRIKDVIVTGAGKNVYPADLEAIYRTRASIKEICVVGVKKGLTEDVHAAIVPQRDNGSTSLDDERKLVQKEIQALARELPSYHRLQGIHIWPEPLPRGKDGQLDRPSILQQITSKETKGQSREMLVLERKAELSLKAPLIGELARLSGSEPEEITEETHVYSDLGLDSLMALELLLFLESHFQIVIPDERVVNFQTVGDILDELRRTGVKEEVPSKEPLEQVRSGLPYSKRPVIDRMVMGASFSGMKVFFKNYFDLELKQREHLPDEGAYIIAANHSSHLDTAAVITAMTVALGRKKAQRLHVIGARDYFFNSPFKSWLFSTCLNVVPIERDEISLAGLRQIRSILARGEPILIFPEGTRSRTGELQSFKPGIGLIAHDTGAPIVPALVGGTYSALPPGKTLPRKNKITVTLGSQIKMADYTVATDEIPRDEVYRKITADVRNAIKVLASEAN